MLLNAFAVSYVSDRGLARNSIYSANRFAKLMGDLGPEQITAEHLIEFRRRAEAAGLGTWAIKGTIKDIRTLIRAAGGDVTIEKIRKPDPNPEPISLSTIDAIWPHLADWSKQWLVLSYWTCLRLADSIHFQREFQADSLAWQANKTKHRHKWPVMPWMQPFLHKRPLPYSSTNDWSKAIVRAEIDRVCVLADVDRFTPQQIRDTGLREWCRADFHVGQVLHGCKLGTIGHYVDVLDVLEPVAPRVRLPDCFGACPESLSEATLLASFRKLDPGAKTIISSTAQRLATG
jgi:hypothetical protein